MLPRVHRLAAVFAALAALCAALSCAPSPPRVAPELWLYQSTDLADSASLPALEVLWRRAAAAGYSHVVLADARFAQPSRQDAAWLARAARVRALADSLRLAIVPGVCTLGREQGGLLAEAPDLAEALPVREARFLVRGGIARIDAPAAIESTATPQALEGKFVREGDAFAIPPHTGRVRAGYDAAIAPWRFYHLRVWLRTREFDGDARVRVTADGRELAFARVSVARDQDWTALDAAFHSLAHTRVQVSLGDWRGSRGVLQWRALTLTEEGPVNLVRRPDTPFTFAGLTEGRDFAFVRDSLLGASPVRGRFDAWHTPPTIRVHAPDGTVLRGSWWSAAVVFGRQVAACPSDTSVMRRYAQQIARVHELFAPREMLLMHDEVRALGGDTACVRAGGAEGRGAADVLAAHLRTLIAAAKPATACVWSDMFDPDQNAIPQYHLVQSDLSGSWQALERDMTVLDWDHAQLDRSLRFFALHGQSTIIAGYYDGDVRDARAYRALFTRVPKVRGAMYTTWQGRYDDLERFAAYVRGTAR